MCGCCGRPHTRNTFSAARKLLRRLRPPSWGQTPPVVGTKPVLLGTKAPRRRSAAVGDAPCGTGARGQPRGPYWRQQGTGRDVARRWDAVGEVGLIQYRRWVARLARDGWSRWLPMSGQCRGGAEKMDGGRDVAMLPVDRVDGSPTRQITAATAAGPTEYSITANRPRPTDGDGPTPCPKWLDSPLYNTSTDSAA